MYLKSRTEKGFSLIELMIALAILAILVGIAYPSYQDSVRKTRRSECKAMLMQVAQAQERHFTEFNQYATTLSTATSNATTLRVGSLTSENNVCSLTISGASATAYQLNAAPTGAHTDSQCGTLSITDTGQKLHSVSSGVACW